ESGRLRIFMAMDEQAYLRIAQRNPALVGSLNRINVSSADETDTIAVMQEQIVRLEGDHRVTYMYQALKEAYRLSERYQHDIAQPGRAVILLEQAARQAVGGFVTGQSVAAVIEQSSGVKVSPPTNDAKERDKLLNMEDLIHRRMVNQTRAVTVVSDALRRARAGVRNEKRPIGTFMFLGPTGVGKTELAKALAAVYFGGEDRIVRIDLNEYVRAEDVSRLIADAADDPRGLTASLIKRPFSVVLLDEVEKAHPQVLTTLLQMLDEGILRDINNREVSFRDAIVIATSNAGAERIRQLIDEGRQLEEFEDSIVNELIDSQQFRPEFLNRFDEIVVFRPLTQAELGQVVERMIVEVNGVLQTQKIQVELTTEAVEKLAAIGYDPRLGARPMRRVIQRSVENLIARRILDGSAQPGQTIMITDAEIQSER
ncbi:ATP-dependent Clp protease ATP-binding subunit, partial [Candidatus Saccharibacteria bacterium]|nr:ATP-dependent Clp protease ATP-binding subunit [Candidatus Saccharibacteria bacterium]